MIERPPQAVFDYVANGFFRNYPRWAPEVVQLASLTPGPIRVGGLGRQVRVDFGRRTEATFRVTRLEAPKLVAFEGISQPFTIAYGFTAAGDHTRVTLIFELLRLEFFMRPFERIIRAAVRDSVAGTMKRLKVTAEREIVLPGSVVPGSASDAPPAVEIAADPGPAAAPVGPQVQPEAPVAKAADASASSGAPPVPHATPAPHVDAVPPPTLPPAAAPDPGLSRA